MRGPALSALHDHSLRQAIRDVRASSAFPRYLEYINAFLPHGLLMENVDGMLSAALQHRPSGSVDPTAAPSMGRAQGSFLHGY